MFFFFFFIVSAFVWIHAHGAVVCDFLQLREKWERGEEKKGNANMRRNIHTCVCGGVWRGNQRGFPLRARVHSPPETKYMHSDQEQERQRERERERCPCQR